ncbi:cell division protein FtsQ/DivIB [Rhodopila sp.]|uniref:cell division protein FtsQ/DivIB n=1 Tax=Rhodopila sp. TaxID=2480087 RepID=UPI002B6D5D67|nr:cell division protein FtsQ/DivIB [Rhodopila sp.]HVZ08902.1 cell division protein FtsQ/DivIB [Rhodopila sp.]
MPRVRQGPRNSVNDRPSPWRLMLRRQRALVKPAAGLVLLGVVGFVLVMIARAAMPGPSSGSLSSFREQLGRLSAASGMRVQDIRIEGRENTPEPLLRAAIGIAKGDPMLGFSLEQTRARIETLSWVEHATVERRLPDTVVIFLEERRPYAVWQHQGKYVLVDRDGQVVADQDVAQFRNLPLIVGAGAPAAAKTLLTALTDRPALQTKVVAAVRVGERRWNLRMTNGMDVMLPEGHEAAALDRLTQLQQDMDVLDRPLLAIDMRLPDRLVFRPRPASGGDNADVEVTPPIPPSAPPPSVPAIAKKPT